MNTRSRLSHITVLLIGLLIGVACNKNEVITEEVGPKPVITLDSETGVYTVKTGNTLTISPSVEHAEGASYAWLQEGELIGSTPSFIFTATQTGTYYFTFQVTTKAGTASEDIRIEVLELTPPVISFALPESGLTAETGRSYTLTPDVQHGENATYEWKLDGTVCGTETSYTFSATDTGNYTLELTVENEDGSSQYTIPIVVVEHYPIVVLFPKPYHYATSNDKTVAQGRTIYLVPHIEHTTHPTYQWEVDGQPIENANQRIYAFTPTEQRSYRITVTVTEENPDDASAITRNITQNGILTASAEITVICCEAEGTYKRTATAESSPYGDQVYAIVPAPGQFVNDTNEAGYTGDETTHEKAIAHAESRLKENRYVSLGGWGGYIIVGFDHSVENKGGYQLEGASYDFAITGNAFDGGSEPGIVYVMQDTNGNGLPDDEWYELKGSEYGKQTTLQDYAITYYRPQAPYMKVGWTDNLDNTGSIPYMKGYHSQPYYYPTWIEEDSYTLYGTRLEPHLTLINGLWRCDAYDWGYADNYGSNRITSGDNGQEGEARDTFFRISDAVQPDGTPADLDYIDFIKVQTGVNATAGAIGELSTEVFRFKDMNILQ